MKWFKRFRKQVEPPPDLGHIDFTYGEWHWSGKVAKVFLRNGMLVVNHKRIAARGNVLIEGEVEYFLWGPDDVLVRHGSITVQPSLYLSSADAFNFEVKMDIRNNEPAS